MTGRTDLHALTGRDPQPVRWWRLAAEAALLMALAAAASSARPGDKLAERVEGMTASASERIESAPYSLRRPRAPARIESVAVDTADLQRALSANGAPPRPGVPRKIGVARDVSPLGTAAETAKRLHWQPTAEGGTVAAVGIASRSALGMRIGVRVFRLPVSAKLRFYASGSSAAHEVSGETVLSTLQRNRDAGDSDDDAATFWSPLIESDDVTLEVELPPGVGPAAMAIAVPRVSHVFASPLVPAPSASCELDATCYGDWRPESDATAKMAFVWAGGSYVCSGTLLNDGPSSATPYFLSANHCIPNQSAASTIQTYWFYRSVSCNSAAYNPAYQTRAGGATLLYSSAATDTAFMQLRDMPPAGARYAAWTTSGVSLGSPLAGLHHPEGDLQKITFGILWGFAKCTGLVGGVFQCDVATPVTGEYLAIAYTSGIHEPGSSGSGLFATIDGKHYLIGQMYGTDSSCINPGGLGFAGRFDVAYNAALSRWLARPAATRHDDLVLDFGVGNGLWMWLNNLSWQQLHGVPARLVATADMDFNGRDDVVVDFGSPYGIWVWMNNSNWVPLHGTSARHIVRADMEGNGQDDVVIDFGPQYGIWVRINNSNWVDLHGISAEHITAADMDNNGQDDLVIDFGPQYGIWVRMNNRDWVPLHGTSAKSITAADMDNNGQDDLVIDFGPQYGIWVRMNNRDWVPLHGTSALSVAAVDIDNNGMDDVVIDFGPQYGIWVRMNNANWVLLHGVSAQHIAGADLDGNGQGDVIVDFGSAGGGIWARMNNSNWVQINGVGAASITAGQIDGN
ncbi:MAG: VCBS repeat-containing protein [Sterolibacteriaceae bacterium]|uniref:VCBS repeat-containing protein n=1 Tax=Candidatus Methylophosphatis roskildensis TaxID=2899263 RepID=A0A9D7HQL5_9PROT|nr:VCBS repeat-containing protein [Candidatus Methylophosphatis roskildensis]